MEDCNGLSCSHPVFQLAGSKTGIQLDVEKHRLSDATRCSGYEQLPQVALAVHASDAGRNGHYADPLH